MSNLARLLAVATGALAKPIRPIAQMQAAPMIRARVNEPRRATADLPSTRPPVASRALERPGSGSANCRYGPAGSQHEIGGMARGRSLRTGLALNAAVDGGLLPSGSDLN